MSARATAAAAAPPSAAAGSKRRRDSAPTEKPMTAGSSVSAGGKRGRDAKGTHAHTHTDTHTEKHTHREEREDAATTGGLVAESSHRPRVLVFGSRGMTARYRHLMEDLRNMLPHHKKDAKLDAKDTLSVVTEIAVTKSCSHILYLDVKKKRDLYIYLSRTPAGPCVKFHVVNVHTMDEMRMTGNCLKGSRPILSFDKAFDDETAAPHLRIIRELCAETFATPRGHPKSQPFHDHVLHFGYAAGRVWLRHYQIVDKAADAATAARLLAAGEQPTTLVEIGPRFVLEPIRIFGGSMGGPTFWSNPEYVGPNDLRKSLSLAKARKYTNRQLERAGKRARDAELVLEPNPVDEIFRDDADIGAGSDDDDASSAE